jgi:hypothetical protein
MYEKHDCCRCKAPVKCWGEDGFGCYRGRRKAPPRPLGIARLSYVLNVMPT